VCYYENIRDTLRVASQFPRSTAETASTCTDKWSITYGFCDIIQEDIRETGEVRLDFTAETKGKPKHKCLIHPLECDTIKKISEKRAALYRTNADSTYPAVID
jgi:hypothetical protein